MKREREKKGGGLIEGDKENEGNVEDSREMGTEWRRENGNGQLEIMAVVQVEGKVPREERGTEMVK